MTKKKTTNGTGTAVKEYIALVACTNDATNKHFNVGDTVTDGDFSTAVIINWLQKQPPVLKEKA